MSTVAIKAACHQPASKRRKLWEIDHKYHCPLIGTCLSGEELRQLAERHAHRSRDRFSDYDVHVSFVTAARERNGLSIATQKRLDKKYASAVRRLARRLDSGKLAEDWTAALETGQVPGMLWALLSHPLIDHELSERIYQDVHMLSHQIGAGQRAELRRLHETQAELSRLRRDFDALTKRTRAQLEAREQELHAMARASREKTTANQRLQARVDELTRQCAAADAAGNTKRLAGLERKLTNLTARLVRIQDERDHWRLATAEAEDQCEHARQVNAELQANIQALEQRLVACLADDAADARGGDLGGRQVLCVGGRLATVEQYRALIDRSNGIFAHHDGGLEDNQNRLEAMLAAADLVICVTEFVSHDAYRRTKQFCKRHAKPHALLANAGLGWFSRALAELANPDQHVETS
jgi:DNA repair exonuclease SbcCD ATPase subunit